MKVVWLPNPIRALCLWVAFAPIWPCLGVLLSQTRIHLRWPWTPLAWLVYVATLISLVLALAIARGWYGTLSAIALVGALSVVACTLVAIQQTNPGMGFMAIGAGAHWGIAWSWCQSEFDAPFFSSGVFWFQGLPDPIPGLDCVISVKGKKTQARVSRLDIQGLFVFGPKVAGVFPARAKAAADLILTFRSREISCRARPITKSATDGGMGLMFDSMSPDAWKNLGDFVEHLRGEGYV